MELYMYMVIDSKWSPIGNCTTLPSKRARAHTHHHTRDQKQNHQQQHTNPQVFWPLFKGRNLDYLRARACVPTHMTLTLTLSPWTTPTLTHIWSLPVTYSFLCRNARSDNDVHQTLIACFDSDSHVNFDFLYQAAPTCHSTVCPSCAVQWDTISAGSIHSMTRKFWNRERPAVLWTTVSDQPNLGTYPGADLDLDSPRTNTLARHTQIPARSLDMHKPHTKATK